MTLRSLSAFCLAGVPMPWITRKPLPDPRNGDGWFRDGRVPTNRIPRRHVTPAGHGVT